VRTWKRAMEQQRENVFTAVFFFICLEMYNASVLKNVSIGVPKSIHLSACNQHKSARLLILMLALKTLSICALPASTPVGVEGKSCRSVQREARFFWTAAKKCLHAAAAAAGVIQPEFMNGGGKWLLMRRALTGKHWCARAAAINFSRKKGGAVESVG